MDRKECWTINAEQMVLTPRNYGGRNTDGENTVQKTLIVGGFGNTASLDNRRNLIQERWEMAELRETEGNER